MHVGGDDVTGGMREVAEERGTKREALLATTLGRVGVSVIAPEFCANEVSSGL